MRNLANDFDKIIIKWLRSSDENATNLAVMLNDFVQAEIASDNKEFLLECEQVRNDTSMVVGTYPVYEHLQLRTEIDSLLIMYDQLCGRIKNISTKEPSRNCPKVKGKCQIAGYCNDCAMHISGECKGCSENTIIK